MGKLLTHEPKAGGAHAFSSDDGRHLSCERDSALEYDLKGSFEVKSSQEIRKEENDDKMCSYVSFQLSDFIITPCV